MEFQKGDRVRMASAAHPEAGKVGTLHTREGQTEGRWLVAWPDRDFEGGTMEWASDLRKVPPAEV